MKKTIYYIFCFIWGPVMGICAHCLPDDSTIYGLLLGAGCVSGLWIAYMALVNWPMMKDLIEKRYEP